MGALRLQGVRQRFCFEVSPSERVVGRFDRPSSWQWSGESRVGSYWNTLRCFAVADHESELNPLDSSHPQIPLSAGHRLLCHYSPRSSASKFSVTSTRFSAVQEADGDLTEIPPLPEQTVLDCTTDNLPASLIGERCLLYEHPVAEEQACNAASYRCSG